MLDTMTLTKLTAGLCSAMLVFLLGNWVASALYQAGHHSEQSYVIDTGVEEEEVEEVQIAFADVYPSADAGAGERLFRQCSACHRMEQGANGTGPYLHAIVGRDIEIPSEWAPGTKMNYRGMDDVEDRANLSAYLATYGG